MLSNKAVVDWVADSGLSLTTKYPHDHTNVSEDEFDDGDLDCRQDPEITADSLFEWVHQQDFKYKKFRRGHVKVLLRRSSVKRDRMHPLRRQVDIVKCPGVIEEVVWNWGA